jgi:tetratricopeptide (TPR) repeat protein
MNSSAKSGDEDISQLLSEAFQHADSDPLKSLALCDRALEIEPWNAEALSLAGTSASDLGRTAQAVEYLRKVVSLQPNYARHHYDLGVVLLRSEQPQLARAMFETAVSLVPSYFFALYNLSISYAYLAQWVGALMAYVRIEQLDHGGDTAQRLRSVLVALSDEQDGWGVERDVPDREDDQWWRLLVDVDLATLITTAADKYIAGDNVTVRAIIDHLLKRFAVDVVGETILNQWRAEIAFSEYGFSAYLRGLSDRLVALPCVRALVPRKPGARWHTIEAGIFKDPDLQMQKLLERTLDRTLAGPLMGMWQVSRSPSEGQAWTYLTTIDNDSIAVRCSGNVFYVEDDSGSPIASYSDYENEFEVLSDL